MASPTVALWWLHAAYLDVSETELCDGSATQIAQDIMPKTVTLKVKYADFKQVTRSITMQQPFMHVSDVHAVLPGLLKLTDAGDRAVRLIGLTVSNFDHGDDNHASEQLSLNLYYNDYACR